ncbi:MAG: hypothetical protein E6Q97_01410 [Desulfurellales bacterium]|nr:MAG: hypothetical protein E6Q97_01410 [Desulfurellales bacterium]
MTTTADKSLQKVLNESNLNYLPTVFQLMKLGNMLGGEVKVVATGLTAAASFDITTSAVRAASTITGLDRNTTDALPAIAVVRSLRVTASGTANSVGSYAITDAGGTAVSPAAGANVGLATLSDDGKTLTFPTTVTAFTLTYMPKPHTDLDTVFKQMGL